MHSETAANGPIRVTVVSPQNESRAGFVVYETSRRSTAERRLRRTLDLLHEAGIAARGAIVDPDPLQALKDGLEQYQPDEVIISTHPEVKSRLAAGQSDRPRQACTSIPVEHVVVDLDEAHERVHILVSRTRPSSGSRCWLRSASGRHSRRWRSLSSHPADEVGVERRLEEAVRASGAGVEATGHLGDGDPYSAVMNAVHDEGADEIVISTFPKTSSAGSDATSSSGFARRRARSPTSSSSRAKPRRW